VGQKQRAVIGREHDARACLAQVFANPQKRPLADRHHAILFAVALANHERAALLVEVVEREMDNLRAAHTGRVKRFKHSAVAQAQRIVYVRLREDAFGFVRREHRTR